jgi:hypothetical protein
MPEAYQGLSSWSQATHHNSGICRGKAQRKGRPQLCPTVRAMSLAEGLRLFIGDLAKRDMITNGLGIMVYHSEVS